MSKEQIVCSLRAAARLQSAFTFCDPQLAAMTKSQAALQLALDSLPEEVLGALARLVRETRFGSIEIVVHEGRITQIERRERVRFVGPERQR